MRKIFQYAVIFLLFFTAACVPNKKITYLQSDADKHSEALDTVMNMYPAEKYRYKLQPGDIISVMIGSLTDEEYDFYQDYITALGPVMSTMQTSGGGGGGMMGGRGGMMGGGMMGGGGGRGGASPMSSGFRIDTAGYVRLPVMGKVKVSDMTMEDAEMAIEEVSKGYFEEPYIRINMLSFRFTVLGEIGSEGMHRSFDPDINMVEAFTIAGNLDEMADRSRIKVIRTVGDQREVAYINILDENFLTSPYFYIKPGDIIVVAPLKARELQRYTLQNYRTAISVVGTSLALILTIITLRNR